MAEESVNPTPENKEFNRRNMGQNSTGNPGSAPVAPEKNEFNSRNMAKSSAANPGFLNNGCSTNARHFRASIGSCNTGNNAGRYSTEKPVSANISQPTVPHYLRASSGTCHDICKYGRRRAYEEDAMKRQRKRTAKLSPNKLKSVKMIGSGQQEMEKVVKHEHSTDAKNHSLVVKPSPDIESADPKKHSLVVKPSDSKSFSPRLKASLDAKTYSPGQNTSSGNKTLLPSSPTKKSISSESPDITKREMLLPSKNVEITVEEGSSIDSKISGTDKKTQDQSVKHSSSVKSKLVNVKPSSASENLDGMYGKGRRNSDVKTGRTMAALRMSAKKALIPPAAPLSPKFSSSQTASIKAIKLGRLKLLSPPKYQNGIHRVEIETSTTENSEKSLRVIRTGTENNAFGSMPEDHAIPALVAQSSFKSLSHAKSPSSLSHEEDDEEIKDSDNEADEFVFDNTVSMETGKVQPVRENHNKTPRLETGKNVLESIIDDHAIPALPSPSSPKYLSHAKSPSFLSHEEDDEEINCNGNGADEFVPDNTLSMEIGTVQAAKENHNKTLRVVTENGALESIPDNCAIPALPFAVLLSSFSHAPSFSSHEEDDEEIKPGGNKADEFVCDNITCREIGKVQLVKENHKKTLRMETGINTLGPAPVDHANLALPSPSSARSLSHVKSPSLLSHEDNDEAIKHSRNKADEFISKNTISMEIGEVQSLKDNHSKTLKKRRVVLSEDKYCLPAKLKFRSGKVLDLKPENNIPRRLRFRRARVGGNKADNFVSDNKPMKICNMQPVKLNYIETLRKSGVIVSKDQYLSPVWLFMSDKVKDLQYDINSPRKLRFKRARDPGAEDDEGDLRRTCKRAGGDAAGAGISSQKVILKHQDVQGKKDAQCLFNNVIKETASKLVESRKSKVKALVGAFETVISLQECKPPFHSIS